MSPTVRNRGASVRRTLTVFAVVAAVLPPRLPAQATGSSGGSPVGPGEPLDDSTFAALSRSLSESGGYFDTDNLISNEPSYLHVMGVLRDRNVRGGAYLGIGPGQNFSYMAEIRPRIAFIIDIRRDNVLQHLLYKALFESADTRVEYLGLLLGRPAPPDPASWHARSVEDIVEWYARTGLDPAAAERARAVVDSAVLTYGIPLSPEDRGTIRRFHDTFMREGLELRFRSFGRPPQPYFPTLRQLLVATDLTGREGNYLADRADFLYLREMQERNLVIPVVGDIAGDYAVRAIASFLRGRGAPVTAFYVSNVEFFLFRSGTFARYARNVAALPAAPGAVLIRSYFPEGGQEHPHRVSGFRTTQSLQTFEDFLEVRETGGYSSYWELVTRDAIDPRVGDKGDGAR